MEIARGAEAVITKKGKVIIKERIAKGYRLAELDKKLRKRRTSMEAKLIREARRAGVHTPHIMEEDRFLLKMDFIRGKKVRDELNKKNCKAIAEKIGESVARLHGYDIIHGDLTTSNMIISRSGKNARGADKGFSIVFIDFGLGFISKRAEDKATDLYLLHEALESTHFDIMNKIWPLLLASYKRHYEGSGIVIKTLSEVEKRGRYKVR
jgi:Kae1-associated kinase Bud32